MGDYADLFNAEKEVKKQPPHTGEPAKPDHPKRAAQTDPVPVVKRSPERVNARTVERPPVAPNARTPVRAVRPVRRSVKRYSFELYDDQIERVKRLALEDQLRGGTLNMSVIVRQALDRYLAELEQKSE